MRRDLAVALPRNRYDNEEWALVLAGKCCEQTSYGTGTGDTWCGEPAPADSVLCGQHQADFFATNGYAPGPGGF